MVFSQQTQALQRRIQALHASAEDDSQSVVLPKVFDELDHVLERVQALAAQLHQLHEQHLVHVNRLQQSGKPTRNSSTARP